MKPVDFGQLVQRIDLELYAPDAEEKQRTALGAYQVYVWINPPADLFERREGIISRYRALMAKVDKSEDEDEINGLIEQLKELGPENDKLLSILLSQHDDAEGEDTHWSPEEIRSYRDGGEGETDPEFIDFLTDEAWRLINEHRSHRQKKIRRRYKTLNGKASPQTLNSLASSVRGTIDTS